ncbi:condensation domain-containing protein, partial [Streptomyces sp. NRRL S-495]|uniref:non-ribosomal peptide synthetase n=1 Tax=Streptomyces sp. NRRL S-495 TaxID=1609133 RepID=UPI0005F99E60
MTDLQDPAAGLSATKRALLAQRLRAAAGTTAAADATAPAPGGGTPVGAAPAATVPVRPPGSAVPLSSGQERLWFMDQFAPGSTAWALAPARRLRGPLDRTALDAALTELLARHEALRMSFPATPEGTAEVRIAEPGPAEFVDASGDRDPAGRAAREVGERVARPFDLAEGPLLRALLVRTAPDEHVLALVMHHIVSDGWSLDILHRELDALYARHAHGTPDRLPELPVQFGDYAGWQRERLAGEALAGSRAYWREELRGVPALELPTDQPRPPVLTFEGAATEFHWSSELGRGVAELARSSGASGYMVLMAALQTLLGRHAGRRDFAIGSAVAGRLHRELEGVVGLFVNMLPIRARLEGDPSFAELLGRVRGTTLDAYTHQEVPFEQMVADLDIERDVSRSAVFQVSFAYQNYGERGAASAPEPADSPDSPASPGAPTAESFGHEAATTRTDLAFYLREKSDGGLYGLLTYRTDLFDAATVRRLVERFELLLAAAVADPDRPISRLPLATPAERRDVLERWAAGPALPDPDGAPATLTALLAATARAHPDRPALEAEGRTVSYRELDERATGLARRLRALGVGPDDRVAVCLEQSPELAVALLGVLKAGGAYLPLDPEQPPARLAHLVADAEVRVLLTDSALRDRFPGHDVAVLLLDTAPPPRDTEPLPELSGPDHLAYVIYTSGSTGTPKGVAVQHRQILNYLAGVRERLRIEPGAGYGLLQSLAFDFSMTMLYLALSTGGRVHLLPRRIAGAELAERIEALDLDHLKMTPSHLAALSADAPMERLLPRRSLVLGGEASAWPWAAGLAALGRCAVFNHYGPTEATVGVTVHEVTADAAGPGSTPIGTPLARCHVLDEAGQPVPPGVTGELYLGGDRLARGYLGRPELTAE